MLSHFYSASALLVMQTAAIATADLSVCLSVRHVLVSCPELMRSSVSAMRIILVSEEVKLIRIFAGDHPSGDVKVKRSPIASENLTNNQT